MDSAWLAVYVNGLDVSSHCFGVLRSRSQVVLQATRSGEAARVRAHNTSTFVGVGTSDYEVLGHSLLTPVGPYSFTSASTAVVSGRIAFAFGFSGASASIDTACSASLVSVFW